MKPRPSTVAEYEDEYVEEEEDEQDDIVDIQTIEKRRKLFLCSFSIPDLDEMQTVASFLRHIATWVIRANWRETHIIGPCLYSWSRPLQV
jgi:hypothetical protein